MATRLLIIEILSFAFALWLGLYLVARDLRNPRLRFTGLGLAAYALGLAGHILASLDPGVARWGWPLLFLPALLWSGATLWLVPERQPRTTRLARFWGYALLPVVIVFYTLGAGTDLIFDYSAGSGALRTIGGYLVFALLVALPLGAALVRLAITLTSTARPRRPLAVMLVATLFFSLGIGLMALPLDWLPPVWILLAIGLDLVLVGLSIAVFDAFDEGEALLPDLLRSLDFSIASALLFGGLVGLTIVLGTGLTFAMLALLLGTIAAAIASQTFTAPLQTTLDRLFFARFPSQRAARANLRAANGAVTRLHETLDLGQLDEDEFARLTRRALSYFGNLPRLAASPLTHLPLVEARLAERGTNGNTLDRATELKTVLAESVARLKPPGEDEFGTSDEWRYYNALYFPYVAGLKVHSRLAAHDRRDNSVDPSAQAAMEWFRTYVPERTLFNWQNAAAKLVAQDLLERSREAA